MRGRNWMAAAILAASMSTPALAGDSAPITLALHGGAGTLTREAITEDQERRIRDALGKAARAGYAVLEDGGAALDAITAAILVLEDAPEFNAGRGAVLTAEGKVEMDASIMTGHDLRAGAVASIRGVRHPILAARGVMERSPHVMLVGDGAEAFAREMQLEFKPESWFVTEFRAEQLRRIQAAETASHSSLDETWQDSWFSTVGAVALDRSGNVAAATSTGGTSNKRFGRVGDSPIIGAGTYADNRACAVSATGHGEYFIRYAVAHEICARMRLGGESLDVAAGSVVRETLVRAGGDGGVIAIDTKGHIAMPFNTEGMYRAAIDRDGTLKVAIFGDE